MVEIIAKQGRRQTTDGGALRQVRQLPQRLADESLAAMPRVRQIRHGRRQTRGLAYGRRIHEGCAWPEVPVRGQILVKGALDEEPGLAATLEFAVCPQFGRRRRARLHEAVECHHQRARHRQRVRAFRLVGGHPPCSLRRCV